VIERHQLAHAQQIGLGEELVGPEALRQLLTPGRRAPAEIADVPAAERRQAVGGARFLGGEGFAQRRERVLRALVDGQPRTVACADIAVAAERALEEERVAFERPVRAPFA
jgi:hypothetical protein